MVARLMAEGAIDLVIGADRVTQQRYRQQNRNVRNCDSCSSFRHSAHVALPARHDPETLRGADVVIEERNGDEVYDAGPPNGPAGIKVQPAFDVTP